MHWTWIIVSYQIHHWRSLSAWSRAHEMHQLRRFLQSILAKLAWSNPWTDRGADERCSAHLDPWWGCLPWQVFLSRPNFICLRPSLASQTIPKLCSAWISQCTSFHLMWTLIHHTQYSDWPLQTSERSHTCACLNIHPWRASFISYE